VYNFKIIKGKGKFLFNVKSLSSVFRAKFVEKLTKLEKENKLKIGSYRRMQMFEKQWFVNIQHRFSYIFTNPKFYDELRPSKTNFLLSNQQFLNKFNNYQNT